MRSRSDYLLERSWRFHEALDRLSQPHRSAEKGQVAEGDGGFSAALTLEETCGGAWVFRLRPSTRETQILRKAWALPGIIGKPEPCVASGPVHYMAPAGPEARFDVRTRDALLHPNIGGAVSELCASRNWFTA